MTTPALLFQVKIYSLKYSEKKSVKLKNVFRGSAFPFEGERLLLLHTLPKGAKVHSATAIIRPVKAPGMNELFVEKISFDNGSGDWGATKISSSNWVEIDFHARRTIHTVTGKPNNLDVTDCTLQVDLGGLFVSIAEDGTALVPGQPELKLTLTPGIEVTLPGLNVAKFKISKTGSLPDIKELRVKSTPANVSLNFNYEPPFWTSSGEMSETQNIPDFAEALQSYLEKAEIVNGFYKIPFVLHSDSIARLNLEIEIKYSKQINILPEAVSEVQLPFDYASLPNQEQGLLTASLPPGTKVIPKLTTAKVVGAFNESRVVFGKTGIVEAQTLIPVKGGLSQAQFINVDKETPVTAFDILIAAVSRKVSLDINILPDSDGKPFDDPLLAEPVKLNIDRESAGSLSWISVNLYREFLFKPQENYWLVIHALDGEAVWGADPAPQGAIPLQYTDSGGLSWRDTVMQDISGALAAHFRLRHTPARYQVPIELQVGKGELARRVSLQRFQPLGRVDFKLDFDEVAEAFNRYLQDKTPDALKEAEHLENGDFEEWVQINDEIRKIASISLRKSGTSELREPVAVKVSPYGGTVFISGILTTETSGKQISTGGFKVFDFICGNEFEIPLSAETILDFVISPNIARIYAISNGDLGYYLYIINSSTREVNDPIPLNLTSRNITDSELNLAGSHLYIATSPISSIPGGESELTFEIGMVVFRQNNLILVLNTKELNNQIPDPYKFFVKYINLDSATIRRKPQAMSHSPVSEILYITCIKSDIELKSESGELCMIDTAIQQLANSEEFIPLVGLPKEKALAISRNGEFAAILCDKETQEGENHITKTDALNVIDLVNKNNVIGFPIEFEENATIAVEFSVDGKYVFVAMKENYDDKVVVIDILKAKRLNDYIQFDEEIKDLVIASPSGYLFAVSSDADIDTDNGNNNDNLTMIQTQLQEAAEWEHTSGLLTPLKLPSPLSQAALFGVPGKLLNIASETAARSQAVPVSGGCTYRFEFLALSCNYGSLAELFWIGDECTQLIDSKQVPIAVKNEDEFLLVTLENRNPLILHSIEIQAPQGAVQAEIRFKVPEGNTALVDQVSFKVTDEKMTNSRLVTKPGQLPDGWKLLSEKRDEITLPDAIDLEMVQTDIGLKLINNGIEKLSLIYITSVMADQNFILELFGRATAEPTALVKPAVNIYWLKSGSEIINSPITMEISPADNATQLKLEGKVPNESIEAEIGFLIPPDTSLEIGQISFRNFENIDVPITFVAQSPGEMVVSDLRVAYEIEEAEPPPVPEKGLCSATPPDRIPGEAPKDACCCCSSCGAQSELIGAEYFETPAGRPAALASCSACGSDLVHYGGAPVKGAKRLSLKGNLSRFRKKAAAKPELTKPSLLKREPLPQAAGKPVVGMGAAKKKTVKKKPVVAPQVRKEKQPSPKEEKRATLAKEILGLVQEPIFEQLKNEKLSKILRLTPEKIYTLCVSQVNKGK